MAVDYTSPHPKFDAHMKKYDKKNMTPKQIIDHLNKGVILRKAQKKTNSVNA